MSSPPLLYPLLDRLCLQQTLPIDMTGIQLSLFTKSLKLHLSIGYTLYTFVYINIETRSQKNGKVGKVDEEVANVVGRRHWRRPTCQCR